jgi:ring-1,2-phenylacetyl-CoA epoxidase subunit PaaE
MITYSLKVAEVRHETADALTVCFKQPGLRKVKYKAGQYLTLIFRINGRKYIRPYSFSSCPEVDEFLEITIKRVYKGIVSNHIIDFLRVGDIIEVMPPMGDFIYNSDPKVKAVCLWGIGSGITPLISIAKYILFTENDVNVHLYYGNTNLNAVIFLNKIEELQMKFPHRFNVKHFLSKLGLTENSQQSIMGRIDEKKVLDILNDQTSLSGTSHYICGPSGLKKSVKNALSIKGVESKYVFVEDFEIVKDPIDFTDIYTQNVELEFNGNKHTLEVIKGKSILDSALDAGIELPYSCQTGNCSTCKMVGLSKDRDDLHANEYLLCCAHPLTDDVKIMVLN